MFFFSFLLLKWRGRGWGWGWGISFSRIHFYCLCLARPSAFACFILDVVALVFTENSAKSVMYNNIFGS